MKQAFIEFNVTISTFINVSYNVFVCGSFNGCVSSSDYKQFSGYIICNLLKLRHTEKFLLIIKIIN